MQLRNIMYLTLFVTVLTGVMVTAPDVFAQGGGGPAFENPIGPEPDNIIAFFQIILNEIVVPIGAVVVAFFIIWSGFLFVTAGGNEEKIKTARTTFTYTVIGAAVLLGAWTITQAIKATVCEIAPDTPSFQCDGGGGD